MRFAGSWTVHLLLEPALPALQCSPCGRFDVAALPTAAQVRSRRSVSILVGCSMHAICALHACRVCVMPRVCCYVCSMHSACMLPCMLSLLMCCHTCCMYVACMLPCMLACMLPCILHAWLHLGCIVCCQYAHHMYAACKQHAWQHACITSAAYMLHV